MSFPLSMLREETLERGVVPSGGFRFLPDDVLEEAERTEEAPCHGWHGLPGGTNPRSAFALLELEEELKEERKRKARYKKMARQVMTRLTHDENRVLIMRYIRGLDYETIARKLHRSPEEIETMVLEATLRLNLRAKKVDLDKGVLRF